MSTLISLLLTVAVSAFVAYPLLRRGGGKGTLKANDHLSELYSRRDTAYSMIKELEFDYQSGILNEEDFRGLEVGYKRKAAGLLQEIDGVAGRAGMEADIERQVREVRGATRRFCSKCGARLESGDRFCGQCGNRVAPAGEHP